MTIPTSLPAGMLPIPPGRTSQYAFDVVGHPLNEVEDRRVGESVQHQAVHSRAKKAQRWRVIRVKSELRPGAHGLHVKGAVKIWE